MGWATLKQREAALSPVDDSRSFALDVTPVVHCQDNALTALFDFGDAMPSVDLLDILAATNENLGLEFKAWMDTRDSEVRAKLARHIAALANHGGGYLIFGVDDQTRKPLGATELALALFSQDAVAGIVKKYLDPRVQVLVEHVVHEGVGYPIVVVPSHGARPVVAIADGP